MNPLFHTDFSISDSLKSVRKSVLIYETIIGSSFSKDGNLLDFTYVFGLQSYVIQHHENGKVVINGIEQELDSEIEGADVREGEYPIIQISERIGELRTSYVLNPEGELMIETPKDVIYANERYYISVENDEYHINKMIQFNRKGFPVIDIL